MPASPDNKETRTAEYATTRGLVLECRLGFGKDGDVWATNFRTALKVFDRPETFSRELACYLRLREFSVNEVLGHHVPTLVDWDSDLLALEMSIVQPPFLLDFAGAQLDSPPDFPPEVIHQWMEDIQEEFATHWTDVNSILDVLARRYGIYMLDVHPGNIRFGEERG